MFCTKCSKQISDEANFCPNCGTKLVRLPDNPKQGATKKIRETKSTCNSCGHIFYYGKTEELEAASAALQNVGKAMMCCGGCLPAVVIPDKKAVDLNKCPKCNSKALTKEVVEHEVP